MSDLPRPLLSPLLNAAGFRHAFFTRAGGVSTGNYETLNFSYSVGDDSKNVTENIARAAGWLGVTPENLYFAQQVHGTDCIVLSQDSRAEVVRATQADAIIGTRTTHVCCVRTADCVPVLIADRVTGQVAAIHAGWRGVAHKIVPQTVSRLIDLGSTPEHLIASIGPHIRADAFEVSEEVAALINAATPGLDVTRRRVGQRPRVSLAESLLNQLLQAGLGPDCIEDLGGCTFTEPDRFFSYRRSGQASGRHLHAIIPRESRAL